MLPNGNRRAIYDVTFGRPAAGGALHRECASETGSLLAIDPRYRQASRAEKGRILDEGCRVTGYRRKYLVGCLDRPAPPGPPHPRRRVPTYSATAIDALAAIWRAADYPWSVRLNALLPLWTPWARRRLQLTSR